jgi:alkylhydroperoxidase family enzyme
VPNYAKVFSGRPEVLARWGKLLAEIKRPMSKRRFELVTFAAALELRNTACSLAHGKALLEFFTAEELLKMKENKFSESVTEAERAIFRFARKIVKDASQVTSGDVDLLKKHGLNDDEIFDVAATAAGRAFFTKLLDALGVETDSTFVQMEYPFRRAMTVGRPIGYRPVERLPAAPEEAGAG